MVFFCCVPNCTKTSRDKKIHRFPVNENECHAWLRLIGRQDFLTMPLEKVKRSYRVCDIHFRPEDRIDPKYFSRQGFVKGSLPLLHMPTTDSVEIQPYMGELPSASSKQGLDEISEVQLVATPASTPINILHPAPSHFSKRGLHEAFGEEVVAGPSHVDTPKKARTTPAVIDRMRSLGTISN